MNSGSRIENLGKGQRAHHRHFIFPATDDGPHVHFGAGRRKRHHGAQRQGFGCRDRAESEKQDFFLLPPELFGDGRQGDEFGAVHDRAPADRQEEIDLFLTGKLHGFHQRFEFRVRFDAAEFENRSRGFGQLAFDLVEDAVFDDTPTAVGDQNPAVARDQAVELTCLPLAEQDVGRVVISEILHFFSSVCR